LKVPELGVIPASHRSSTLQVLHILRFLSNDSPRQSQLVIDEALNSKLAESFRLALASILLTPKNSVGPGIIAVSSANPNEGKTTVTSNLGIALARINQRVLLIDGDLRRPKLHEIFGVRNEVGLRRSSARQFFDFGKTDQARESLLTSSWPSNGRGKASIHVPIPRFCEQTQATVRHGTC
jgi:hypothetical protein